MINIAFKKYSKFIIKSDNSSWVLDELKKEISDILKNKYKFINSNLYNFIDYQHIFFINKYELAKLPNKNLKIAASYFHTEKNKKKENEKILNQIINDDRIKCIQVTNNQTKNFLIKKGVKRENIFKIPIGIQIEKFKFISLEKKKLIKKKNKLKDYLVIGSFQKDGKNWGEGNEPKMVKGPDILIKLLKILNKKYKIHVVLTGPARGYVINNLKKLKISYEHHFLKKYDDITKYYSLIDAYVVTSREEGGPRSVLESMASGVLIYSTKVGQAKEIIRNNSNGYLYEIKNLDQLSEKIIKNYLNDNKKKKLIKNGRLTAIKYSHKKMKYKWYKFFEKLRK